MNHHQGHSQWLPKLRHQAPDVGRAHRRWTTKGGDWSLERVPPTGRRIHTSGSMASPGSNPLVVRCPCVGSPARSRQRLGNQLSLPPGESRDGDVIEKCGMSRNSSSNGFPRKVPPWL